MKIDTSLISYHGDPDLKAKHDAWIRADIAADRLVGGTFGDEEGDGWQGCQWGCYMRSASPHYIVEKEIGIPVQISIMADSIFEGLNRDKGKEAARKFVEDFFYGPDPNDANYLVGKNLNFVYPRFASWLLSDIVNKLLEMGMKPDDEANTHLQSLIVIFDRLANGEEVPDSELSSLIDARALDLARALDRARALARALDLALRPSEAALFWPQAAKKLLELIYEADAVVVERIE